MVRKYKEMNRLIGYIICIPFLALILILSTFATSQIVHAGEKSPYQSGYDHGCDDADISDPDDRYINQPEKGPSFHTDEFMRGYNSGYNSCSQHSESGGDDAANNNGLRVIVHMAGVGFACVYSEREDLGCNEVDDPGMVEFVFSEGAVRTGLPASKIEKMSPFTNVKPWRMDQNQSQSMFIQEFRKTITSSHVYKHWTNLHNPLFSQEKFNLKDY